MPGGTVFVGSLGIGIVAAIASILLVAASWAAKPWSSALRAMCFITAAALLIQAGTVIRFRLLSPDVSLNFLVVPVILIEALAVGMGAFVAFDSRLRYIGLAVSAIAPLILTLVRHTEA